MGRCYQDLLVWQKAIQLVRDVYVTTRSFPREEIYGLTSQLRRSAVSIPSNIAEGQGRRSRGDFLQFLRVARGSLMEAETQIIIASDLSYLAPERTRGLLSDTREIGKMLDGLMESIRD